MFYTSTRDRNILVTSSEAIVNGISPDGGLYIPKEIPKIDSKIEDLINLSYKDLAHIILKKFLTDFDDSELSECINSAYNDKFDTSVIVPLVEKEDVHFLELYHGPTLAFKDMALSILPHLLKVSMRKENIKKKIVILTATSGDTGKAALEGFSNVDDVIIIVFFPINGVSEIQKKQMVTQEGKNTFVVGINGNFDDAQNGVKQIFNDKEFGKILNNEYDCLLSSANSINIGRLLPQIVYYFYGYLNLLRNRKINNNEPINIAIPTGNFGNILAAYYAKKMGLPVNRLICASNENNVLSDFLKTGIYDRRRELKLTSSPSMDILISSNLERLLYEICGKNDNLIKKFMGQLQEEGKYEITQDMKKELSEFYGGYATEDEIFDSIANIYKSSGYVMDTHTAVAYSVYEKYKKSTGDETPAIIASTASPFKFGRSICNSLDIDVDKLDDFKVLEELSETTGLKIPQSIKLLQNKKIIHTSTCKKSEIKSIVEKILKG